jgi:hypothetical protein
MALFRVSLKHIPERGDLDWLHPLVAVRSIVHAIVDAVSEVCSQAEDSATDRSRLVTERPGTASGDEGGKDDDGDAEGKHDGDDRDVSGHGGDVDEDDRGSGVH